MKNLLKAITMMAFFGLLAVNGQAQTVGKATAPKTETDVHQQTTVASKTLPDGQQRLGKRTTNATPGTNRAQTKTAPQTTSTAPAETTRPSKNTGSEPVAAHPTTRPSETERDNMKGNSDHHGPSKKFSHKTQHVPKGKAWGWHRQHDSKGSRKTK